MWKVKAFPTDYNPNMPIEEQILKFLNEHALLPGRVKIVGYPPIRGEDVISSAVVFYYVDKYV